MQVLLAAQNFATATNDQTRSTEPQRIAVQRASTLMFRLSAT